MPWGVAIAAGASALGSYLSSTSAAGAEKGGANQLIQYANGIYNTAGTNLAPYMSEGSSASNLLQQDLPSLSQGFNPTQQELESLPGYQFELNQGLEATQNGYAAKGLGVSGAAMKGASSYAQGLASTDLTNYSNIFNTNRLSTSSILTGAAGLGESAASSLGNIGESGLGAVGTGITGSANAQAAADTAPYSAASGGINNLLQLYLLNQNSGLGTSGLGVGGQ